MDRVVHMRNHRLYQFIGLFMAKRLQRYYRKRLKYLVNKYDGITPDVMQTVRKHSRIVHALSFTCGNPFSRVKWDMAAGRPLGRFLVDKLTIMKVES